jgi:hypothetical protein
MAKNGDIAGLSWSLVIVCLLGSWVV